MTGCHDDSKLSLLEIANRHRKPIVSLLLDSQEHQVPQQKFLGFIKHLECFYLGGNRDRNHPGSDDSFQLFRWWINAFNEKNYVALSYTWNRSEYEDQSSERFQIQTRDRRQFFPSPVRDCIFDRALNYMRKLKVEFLWIDRHSIRQKSCKRVGCAHEECNQKSAALQTMDLVYKLSNHPVALLGRPIQLRNELDLLARILTGELVNRDPETRQCQLSSGTSHADARSALRLLTKITRDIWWTRAWTFQENYRAGTNMTLLIPHPRHMEDHKKQYNFFGDVLGELCINSVKFSEQVTWLCLAFQKIKPQAQEEWEATNYILSRAGKYTILLTGSDSLSPAIITDVEKRSLSVPSDRLAITANCCQYQIRLSTGELLQKSQSLSLSLLAMCLLNGEILHNTATNSPVSQMTVSKYLKAQLFNEFYPPKDKRSLTFNKGCRFIDVELNASGILTKGHLWKLGRIIPTETFPRLLPRAENPSDSLTMHQRKRLTQLAKKLKIFPHVVLAKEIEEYLCYESSNSSCEEFWNMTFPQSYMRTMAVELARAIDEGKTLRLGSIMNNMGQVTPCTAVFIWEGDEHENRETARTKKRKSEDMESQDGPSDNGDRRQTVPPAFVFTASRPKTDGSDRYDSNDLDRHVSFEVECTGLTAQMDNCVPRLHIKRWLLGLCFFSGFPRTDVVFPWPPGLEAIGSMYHVPE